MDSAAMSPHMRPPEAMRLLMKHWHKSTLDDIESGSDIVDFAAQAIMPRQEISPSKTLSTDTLDEASKRFIGTTSASSLSPSTNMCSCFEIKSLPGLFVYPSLLSIPVQIQLLNRVLHRDLSNSNHRNNLIAHYTLPYPILDASDNEPDHDASFFEMDKETPLQPKDPAIHKPLSVSQMLDRKLRWITLGGQYDWTAKSYPAEKPPTFPTDIGRLLSDLWPDVDAQAAIVNFYTPGDTLSVHRDVSEECDRGLISISIGCDALFIVGNQDGSHCVTVRLRSGDAIMMSGESRFAWHAVPKVLPDTCPQELEDWPDLDGSARFSPWKGWLKRKRINLNVRQMRPHP